MGLAISWYLPGLYQVLLALASLPGGGHVVRRKETSAHREVTEHMLLVHRMCHSVQRVFLQPS
jgi:hypothetical protein